MESEIIKMAVSQGLWATLFVVLFFYTLKQYNRREEVYQATIKENQIIIKKITDRLAVVENIKKDVDDIKKELSNKGD